MRTGLIVTVACLLALVACSGGPETDDQVVEVVEPSSSASAPGNEIGDEPRPDPVAPDPDGTYTESCDYLLGDFTESETGYRFVADARLRNTGNIGTVTRVIAKWYLAGGDEIVEQRTVRMDPATGKRVGFVHPATGDEIDLHQALGYSAKTCTIKATIVDTFGEPEGSAR